MKMLKAIIRTAAGISLIITAVTGGRTIAILLLAFGCMSLGIVIGERINGGIEK